MPPSRSILVVEDDAEIRDLIANALTSCGYQALTAGNGREAIDRLSTADPAPSVILLDWMMPVMGGFEFLTYQAADENLREIPVLVLSAVDRALKISGLPVAAVLEKPVRMRTLLEVIDRLSGMPRRPLPDLTGRFRAIDPVPTGAKTVLIRPRKDP